MSKGARIYLAGVAGVGLLVYLAGVSLAPEGKRGVLAGVVLATLFQLLLFALATLLFAGNRLAAYGVGLIGRLLLVVVGALVVVPASGLPAAPFLFSLVTVLFATILLEPVVMVAGERNKG